MSRLAFLSSLNLGTLIIVFVIVAAAFAYFLRKRSNRHPMEGRSERNVAKDLDENRQPPDHSARK
jgi:hypothetical protein